MRTSLREFSSEEIWMSREHPEHFLPSMVDRRFERRSLALEYRLAQRESLAAWLAETGPEKTKDLTKA